MHERLTASYHQLEASITAGLPKYLRVCETIEREIASGYFKPGDKLPAELDLTRILPASLGTVQKALRTLAERGVVVREHGKGTFVADSRVEESKLWHLRFLGEEGALLPVYVSVHGVEAVDKPGPWVRFLGDHPFYVCVHRSMDINHEFTVSAHFYVAGPPFQELLKLPSAEIDGTSLRSVLADRFGVATQRATEQVGCDAAPTEECAMIGLKRGSIALLYDVFGHGFRDEPVYFQRYWIPPNRHRLQVLDRP